MAPSTTSDDGEASSFGEALFNARTSRGLSQRELARMAGVAVSILSETENGRRPPPPEETMQKLFRALGVSASEEGRLRALAATDRSVIGLYIGRHTPPHVADLLRDIVKMGHALSEQQVAAIRAKIAAMDRAGLL